MQNNKSVIPFQQHSKKITPLSQSLLIATSVLLMACGDNKSNTSNTATSVAAISSQVVYLDESNNASNKDAGAYLFYKTAGVSTKAGYAKIEGLPTNERVVINAAARGYAEQSRVVNLVKDEQRESITFNMVPLKQITLGYDHKKDGTFKSANNVGITITANSLARIDATALDKPLRVYLTDIDVSNESLLPGDLKAQITNQDNKKTEYQPLEAFSAIYVKLQETEAPDITSRDYKTGEYDNVNLKINQTMNVSFPAAGKTAATMDLYAFDTVTGIWKKETALTLNQSKTAYEGKTTRLGHLALMQPITNVATITGCVADKNQSNIKLQGVEVILNADNYAGYDQAVTDANGNFSLNAKSGSNVTLQVKAGKTTAEPITLSNVTNNQPVNNGKCIGLDVGVNGTEKVSGQLTWQGSQDYDLNVILPDGDILFYGKREDKNINQTVTKITEVKGNSPLEKLAYTQLMKGKHYFFVNNFYNNYSPAMRAANVQLTLNKKTYTPPAGEVTKSTSRLIDTRTPVWLAAIMTVNDDCTYSIAAPSASEYKVWLKDYEFKSRKVNKTDNEMLGTVSPEFCK